ncbi:SDR family NAD(P)-dependent oxidoreductase [Phytomonospora sp. NPDC050363]|uniref:SDR family NAD(P)-dependent oxidoreductase n=1 Tax=Phytomonospora sp. NPDC050363 TaxID=3155642 RepID=UPI0033EB00DD
MPSDSLNAFGLNGKSALITGASRGIGRAVALALAGAGADVALLARDTDLLDDVSAEVKKAGREALVLTCDLEDPAQIDASVEQALQRFPGLSIVVNNAGGMSHVGPFLELTDEDWAQVWTGNLISTVRVLRRIAPHLISIAGGSVINMSSAAGLAGVPMLSHYAAVKAATVSLTRSLAVEWAQHGVRVNALTPGWVTTDLTEKFSGHPDVSAALTGDVPLHRWGSPEDITGAAVYLAAEASALVTGAVLTLDGGLLAQPGGSALTGLLPLGRISTRD